ncbi:MAG: hypothetical protein LUG93_01655 [Lachnospiraceae bacterium]|nr:hypothetical protein [Lachnospiraceae bacterium]
MKKKWLSILLAGTLCLSGLAAPVSSAEESDDTASETDVTTAVSDQEYIESTLNLANNEDQTWTYQESADAWVLSIVSAVAYPELPDEQGVSVCVPGAYVTGIDTDGDGEADVTAESAVESGSTSVNGSLVIDYEAEVVSTNGQTYTAATAPVILNTGAAGYSSSNNSTAATTYAAEGYINVACGNRGKQDTATDDDGNTYYTGDAPSCLADQKAATRYVKYNILLGNLPGSVDYFVSTGGSGGGAHATMFAATSNNSDFYDYQIEAGAVGVYRLEDGSYSTTVTIDGVDYEISDGAWGCVAYSAITSLYEGDMAMAFEYYMDTTYSFSSSFQEQLAAYLSEAYMEYINEQNLSVEESAVGFDLNGDGDMDDTIALSIEYDLDAYPETNGYYGTYLDLYLAEFTSNLQWYLDNLDYAEGWTWFDEDGNALSDEEVAAMTTEDKATAFIEGRYAASSTGMGTGDLPSGMNGALDFMDTDEMGGMDLSQMGDLSEMGDLPDGDTTGGMRGNGGGRGGMDGTISDDADTADADADSSDTDASVEAAGLADGELPDGDAADELPSGDLPDGDTTGELPSGDLPDGDTTGELPDGDLPDSDTTGELPDDVDTSALPDDASAEGEIAADEASEDAEASEEETTAANDNTANQLEVGTPDEGTTQSASGSKDSANYSTYEEMVEAYEADIASILEGDKYGNNIVSLYNPLNYIGAEGTEDSTWVRIVMGASEGDMSMFTSLNLQIAMLNAGVDAEIEWQWNGGHVPSEIFGNSLALYVDQMYGEYVEGAATIEKTAAETQTTNGTATEATGTDLTSWVNYEDITNVSFSLADAVAYRTAGASKAIPGFDVIDYGQEDYVFGNTEQDARHWNTILLDIFQTYADVLSPLFNQG